MIIRSEEIYKKANSIVKSCGTRDTLKIARELGIHLHFLDNLNDLLGMYTYRHKERHILLNSNMEYLIMQMVCGHEIGHDTFHRDLAKGNEPLPEFVLFDMRTKHEYEANAFASHMIIDDDELIDLMKQDYDVVQLSACLLYTSSHSVPALPADLPPQADPHRQHGYKEILSFGFSF